MHPSKVNRDSIVEWTDLPNVGPATAGDLVLLGYRTPNELRGQDAIEMYDRLCQVTGVRHDPCVVDVFLAITRFMDGGESKAWWEYTAERKKLLAERTQ